MSKIENKIKKNITKEKEMKEKLEKKENYSKKQVINLLKIIIAILLTVLVVCFIAKFANGDFKKDEEESVDYTNIVAGQTFTRSEDEYYVLFYDDEAILDKIGSVTDTIYKVDLNSSLNKNIVSEEGNPKAEDAESLKINGTTIIKIEGGKNVSYIEGYDAVVDYLSEL